MDKYFNKVDKLIRRFKTDNPFEICKIKDIDVTYENLGSLKGYTTTISRIHSIHINSDLNEEDVRFTCAHELGHIICRHKQNTIYLSTKTFISTGKTENEANMVATHILLRGFSKEELEGYSLDQISQLTGIKSIYLQMYFSAGFGK